MKWGKQFESGNYIYKVKISIYFSYAKTEHLKQYLRNVF